MNIENLTIGQLRNLSQLLNSTGVDAVPGPWKVGQQVFIRTVTNYWTGRVAAVYPNELILEDAAWIADTGRFADMFTNGPSEVEPVDGPVGINRGAIVDWAEYNLELPQVQK